MKNIKLPLEPPGYEPEVKTEDESWTRDGPWYAEDRGVSLEDGIALIKAQSDSSQFLENTRRNTGTDRRRMARGGARV